MTNSLTLPLRLLLRYGLTILLLWSLTQLLPQWLIIDGNAYAFLIAGALVFVLNMFLRPILQIIAMPLKLFFTLIAIILTNVTFLWVLETVALRLDPSLIVMTVEGGIGSWLVIALLLGLGNWVIHKII